MAATGSDFSFGERLYQQVRRRSSHRALFAAAQLTSKPVLQAIRLRQRKGMMLATDKTHSATAAAESAQPTAAAAIGNDLLVAHTMHAPSHVAQASLCMSVASLFTNEKRQFCNKLQQTSRSLCVMCSTFRTILMLPIPSFFPSQPLQRMLEEEQKAVAAASQPSLFSPRLHASTTSNQVAGSPQAGPTLCPPAAALALATVTLASRSRQSRPATLQAL